MPVFLHLLFLPNVKVMAHPLAGANVDHGVGVVNTGKHLYIKAARAWMMLVVRRISSYLGGGEIEE
jgi:hypothetical protein